MLIPTNGNSYIIKIYTDENAITKKGKRYT